MSTRCSQLKKLVLDLDSSEIPVHGHQEGSAYNSHFGCDCCYHMLYDDPKDYPPSDPVPISSAPDEKPFKPDLSWYWLEKLDWFDVDRIAEGLTIPRKKGHHPFIWIDTDRGILYSFWTD